MMTSAHVLTLSVACIAAGTVLLLFQRSETMAATLIAAGIAGFGKEVAGAKASAKKEAARADAVAQELFEKTGTVFLPRSEIPKK
jgi:hypothetical protein